MIEMLLISGGCVVLLAGVALALPCEACRLRRERMKRAVAAWQASKNNH